MSKRRLAVLQRRVELRAKIGRQREQMAEIALSLQPALQVADQTLLAVNFMRRHPALIAGLAGIAVVRRRGLVGLVKGGWRVWRAWRYVSGKVRP
jgi:hypothetical protein